MNPRAEELRAEAAFELADQFADAANGETVLVVFTALRVFRARLLEQAPNPVTALRDVLRFERLLDEDLGLPVPTVGVSA